MGKAVAALVTSVMVTVASPASAQSVGAQLILAHFDHTLLGSQRGGGVLLTVPLRDPKLAVRLELERTTGISHRDGIACAGLVDPRTCPTERVRDAGRSTGGAAGLTYRQATEAPLSLGILGRARVAGLHADTRGTETGNRIAASKLVWGGEIGLLLGLRTSPRAPLSVELGGTLGFLTPFRNEQIVDGYTPFTEGSRTARLWLGVTWRVGSP